MSEKYYRSRALLVVTLLVWLVILAQPATADQWGCPTLEPRSLEVIVSDSFCVVTDKAINPAGNFSWTLVDRRPAYPAGLQYTFQFKEKGTLTIPIPDASGKEMVVIVHDPFEREVRYQLMGDMERLKAQNNNLTVQNIDLTTKIEKRDMELRRLRDEIATKDTTIKNNLTQNASIEVDFTELDKLVDQRVDQRSWYMKLIGAIATLLFVPGLMKVFEYIRDNWE